MENYNVVLMDHGNNWERVAKRTKGTSCTVFSPKKEKKLQINPWKVPYGFDPKDWMSKVLVQFCRAEGLLERSKVLIEEVVTGLYKEFGVFEEGISAKEVSERSSKVTFQKLYTELEAYLSKKVNAMVKERLLSHFSDFQGPDSFLCSFLGSSNGVSIDALIHTEGVTVLDCEGLRESSIGFVSELLVYTFFCYAYKKTDGFFAKDESETFLCVLDAEIYVPVYDFQDMGVTFEPDSLGSDFGKIQDAAAASGLYLFSSSTR